MADKTSEVADKVEIVDKPVVVEKKPLTRDEAKATGATAAELERMEKRGMLAKPEEKKVEPEQKTEAKTDPEPKKDEAVERAKSSLPDLKFTPDEEATVTKTFGAGHPLRAFYFRAKNERKARQAAEQREKDKDAEIARLKAEGATQPLAEGEVDPDDLPLTPKRLRELQKQEAEALDRRRQEDHAKRQRLVEAQVEQEEYVAALPGYEDFKDVTARAKEVIQNVDTLFASDKVKHTKALKLLRELQVAAYQADQIGVDDYNAAFIAYELGTMHPDHGKAQADPNKTGTSKEDPKGDGHLTPEQIRKAEENTQRKSSASLQAGGGKRVVSASEVTLKEFLAMSPNARATFREKHPEQYRLLRG